MKTSFRKCVVAVIFGFSSGIAQNGNWEPVRGPLAPPNSYEVGGVVADGYGQHVITNLSSGNGDLTYYLFGNNGETIATYSEFPIHNGFSSTITSYDGVVTVVYFSFDAQSNKLIRAVQSTDGGANWSAISSRITSIGAQTIDAFADQNGVHVVWSDGTDVYYERYRSTHDWTDRQKVTGFSSGDILGNVPKVITSGTKIIVSFITSIGFQNEVVATRDCDASTFTWDDEPRVVGSVSGFRPQAQSIARLGNETHLMMTRGYTSPPLEIKTAKRIGDNDWGSPVTFDFSGNDEYQNHRRKIVSNGNNLFTCYNYSTSLQILFRSYDGTNWSDEDTVESAVDVRRSTLSASKTGVYVFWNRGQAVTLWMGRKVFTLEGNLTENMFWTGNNWITDNTSIEPGYTVRMLNGDVHGSVMEISPGKVLRVKPGATLIVDDGAQLKFGSGATLVVEGNLIVNGTLSDNAIFTRSGTSGTWGGIVFESGGSGDIRYADFSYCGTGVQTSGEGTLSVANCFFSDVSTAVSVGGSAEFTMTNCTIDNADIGVDIVSSDSDLPPLREISNCTISNIMTAAIAVEGYSNLLISGNTIEAQPTTGTGLSFFAASPTLLENHITGTKYGAYCASGSAPVFENELAGGCNLISENDHGVYCDGPSDAILGYIQAGPVRDEGGQNNISGNFAYDVVLRDKSHVLAHNNWWGTQEPGGGFDIEEGSELVYDPWLGREPECPGGTSILAGAGSQGEDDPRMSPGRTLMNEAIMLRMRGEYRDAASKLRSLISSTEIETRYKRWALSQLLAVSQRLKNPGLSEYLENLLNTNPSLARYAKRIFPTALLYEGSVARAGEAYSANISSFPNSTVERDGLYGKFLIALHKTGNLEEAQSLYGLLAAKYPESIQTGIAGRKLESYVSTGSHSNPTGLPNSNSCVANAVLKNGRPFEFGLEPNYPNPFNPVTMIAYTLPTDAHASLRLYDVLGREVLTLVDDIKLAGEHRVNVDASNLSSGVYLYRLTASNFTAVRKMVVVK